MENTLNSLKDLPISTNIGPKPKIFEILVFIPGIGSSDKKTISRYCPFKHCLANSLAS
jgi:hypothetical protein